MFCEWHDMDINKALLQNMKSLSHSVLEYDNSCQNSKKHLSCQRDLKQNSISEI